MCVVLIFIKSLRLLNVIRQTITIFVASFKCSLELGRILMALNLVKRAIVAYPLLKSGQFRLLGIDTIRSHCSDYYARRGIIYLKRCGLLSIIK